jgi:predicted transcriptional regulator
MKRDDAEEFTQALGQIVAGSWRQIALAQRLGVPQALGLELEDWVRNRLGGYIRLSVPERREAVKELVDEGLSQRDIGEILGVDQSTIHRDADASRQAEIVANDDAGDADASPDAAAEERERERVAKLTEENKRETLLRLTEAAYRGTTAWIIDEFVAEFTDRLSDPAFHRDAVQRLRLNVTEPDIDAVKGGAAKLATVLSIMMETTNDRGSGR